jgi:hypothetical protein
MVPKIMMAWLTLNQLSSIFTLKCFVFYTYTLFLLSFGSKSFACTTTSKTASVARLILVKPENTFQLSKSMKIDNHTKHKRTTIGTLGSLIDTSEINNDRVPVDSAELGDAVGYLLAGTFFTATVAQTLYNWDSTPVNTFLSTLADRIVPKLFEATEDSDTRRADDYTDNDILNRRERYCFRCSRKCSGFFDSKSRIHKR